MLRRIVSILLFLLFYLGMSGCSETQPLPKASSCPTIQLPDWIDDSYVGISRITASGNKNDQKKIALQRAIADLLMTKGSATGHSTIALDKNLFVTNEDETLRKRFTQNSVMNVSYEKLHYSIKVTDIWRNPCTKELYVKIEEN